MTSAERVQAGALLAQAEAIREQAAALMHMSEGQIRAVNAFLGAEPPSPEAIAVAEKIFSQDYIQPRARHYGSVNRVPTPPPGGES